jgi:PAS domain S-box-containing protein
MSKKSADKRLESGESLQSALSGDKYLAQTIWRVVPSAIFTVDTNKIITGWNNKAEEVTGYSAAEVIGKECSFFALEPCIDRCGVFSSEVEKPIIARECHIRTKDGEQKTISKNADLLFDSKGEIIGAVESFEDITDRKEVESQLVAERDKFISMLLALDQGMHILNRDFIIEYQNEILKEGFGDQVGHKCYEVYKQRDTPCEVCRMQEAIDNNMVQRTELLMDNGLYYEQSYAPFTDVGGETKVLILLRDITEEKTHQAETMRAAQLASIGELAAGVAHEVNNPINGIINYAQLLLDDSDSSGRDGDMLKLVIKEGERIAEIVRNLLSFARQHGEDAELVAVGTVMGEAVALISHQLGKDGITLDVDIPADLPLIKVNDQQLQQVFLNLLSNARYALNQRFSGKDEGKRIEVLASMVEVGGQTFVRTKISDFGIGIPQRIISKIFDPFFSSKKPGEGTGLGLSISHGIIKNFNGTLRVESQEGIFTSLIVDLPQKSEDKR